jgi:hypothetical protein
VHTTLTSIQQTTLEYIAAQCPLTGGDAVLRARLLLQSVSNIPIRYNDETACAIIPRNDNHTEIVNGVTFSIAPNPNNGEFAVQYSGFGELFLFNAYGQIIRSILLPEGGNKMQINLSNLPSGVYTCFMPGTEVQKIVIQH